METMDLKKKKKKNLKAERGWQKENSLNVSKVLHSAAIHWCTGTAGNGSWDAGHAQGLETEHTCLLSGHIFIPQTYPDTKFPSHFATVNVIKGLYKWF